MYNIKVFKYPSGWQYRVYSSPVGYCDKDSIGLKQPKEWFNPFDCCYELGEPLIVGEFEEIHDDAEIKKERSIKNSMNRTINRVYHLARSNMWDWFITLTFDPEKVDSFDYKDCVKKLGIWLNHLRRYAPDLCCSGTMIYFKSGA